MEIKLKAETDDSDDGIYCYFSNESLVNNNFIDLLIGENTYTFLVEDLFRAIKVFEEIRINSQKDDRFSQFIEALNDK